MKEYKLFLSMDRSNAEDYLNLSAKEGYTLHSIVPVGERSMLIAMERTVMNVEVKMNIKEETLEDWQIPWVKVEKASYENIHSKKE